MPSRIAIVALLAATALSHASAASVVLIAGRPSHPPGQHEHNAGVRLLEKWLKTVPGIQVTAYYNGWPENPAGIDTADAIFVFADGGNGHPVFRDDRGLEPLRKAAARGAGLMFLHYAVEPPADKGRPDMLDWIGGYFEINYSVNPHFDGDFKSLPNHPIARGVKPFKIRDEWYYNMRFRENMRNVTPILTAIPPPESLSRPDGTHSGNPDVRSKAGQPHVVAWAAERPNGGRGVGFTGAHFHSNWGDENFRKLVLNSLLWVAKVEVPRDGVNVAVTAADLTENLDPKPGRGGAQK